MPEKVYDDITRKALEEMDIKVEDDEEDVEEEEEQEEEDLEEEELEDDEDVEETDSEEEGDEDDEEDDDDLTGDETFETVPPKRTKEEKAHYAFNKLRVENKELSTKISKLDELAKSYGFASHDDMLTKLEEDKLRKEAAAKKVDPDYYIELRKTQQKVAELEQARKNEKRAAALNKFVSDLDSFAKDYKLSAEEKTKLVTRMEEDGISAEDVVRWKNPRAVFKGYVEDKIVKNFEQKQLEKEARRKRIKEERHSEEGTPPNITMDALVQHMLKQRKNNY